MKKIIQRIEKIAFLVIGVFIINSCIDSEYETVEEQYKLFDIDGNEYKVDTILGRYWMVENLKTSRYRNGDPIPNVTDNEEWANLKTGAFAWYNNDPTHDQKLGKLYNWYAVRCCDICPEGWRIPTLKEINKLIDHFKSRFWTSDDDIIWTDFKSIGAERRNAYGHFDQVLRYPNHPLYLFTGFWSSNIYSISESYIIYVYARPNYLIEAKLDLSIQPKNTGLSVKCIKEE